MNKETFDKIFKFATKQNKDRFYEPLTRYMVKYEINTLERMSMFLSNVIHESGSLRYVKELASGAAYEGRKNLGNVVAGDGIRYKGRGLIQVTGRANYNKISKDTGIMFISNPELLEAPEYAAMSACWFWDSNNLNKVADSGDFKEVVKIINGGYNGWIDRVQWYNHTKKILSEVY